MGHTAHYCTVLYQGRSQEFAKGVGAKEVVQGQKLETQCRAEYSTEQKP